MPSMIVTAHVEPNDDELTVRWDFHEEASATEIAVGTRADVSNHTHVATVGPDDRQTTIKRLRGQRQYVSLRPQGGERAFITAERLVPFQGAGNFRDMGGYSTTNGGRTRWGAVYRADGLFRLTPDDVELFGQLGVKTVFDLRSDEERDTNPNRVGAVACEIVGRPPEAEAGMIDLSNVATFHDGERMLAEIYLGALKYSAPRFGTVYRNMATHPGHAWVIHCHAGKDRTGMVAALLLTALGVERERVLDDYALTATYRIPSTEAPSFASLVGRGVTPEAAIGVMGAPRWAMAQALEALDAEHGGIETFLLGPAGLTSEELSALRNALVQSG